MDNAKEKLANELQLEKEKIQKLRLVEELPPCLEDETILYFEYCGKSYIFWARFRLHWSCRHFWSFIRKANPRII
ncbi:MAG: hypothetical protein JXK08_09960 [Flavobacteriaceae bacterium]|nr:hypothetical protein [Flavobacteriaceae bacterium]